MRKLLHFLLEQVSERRVNQFAWRDYQYGNWKQEGKIFESKCYVFDNRIAKLDSKYGESV